MKFQLLSSNSKEDPVVVSYGQPKEGCYHDRYLDPQENKNIAAIFQYSYELHEKELGQVRNLRVSIRKMKNRARFKGTATFVFRGHPEKIQAPKEEECVYFAINIIFSEVLNFINESKQN